MFNNNNIQSNDTFVGSNVTLKEFDYNSFHRAVVTSIIDPQKLGRIRIRIPSLHYNTQDNQLPYATPACFTGLGNQVGQFFLPPVGAIVWVTFEFSDEHRPIYFGGIPTLPYEGKTQFAGHGVDGDLLKKIEIEDIPIEYKNSESIIYKSPKGSIIYMGDKRDYQFIRIIDSIGQKIELINGKNAVTGGNTQDILIQTDPNTKFILQPGSFTMKLGTDEYKFDKEKLDELFNR